MLSDYVIDYNKVVPHAFICSYTVGETWGQCGEFRFHRDKAGDDFELGVRVLLLDVSSAAMKVDATEAKKYKSPAEYFFRQGPSKVKINEVKETEALDKDGKGFNEDSSAQLKTAPGYIDYDATSIGEKEAMTTYIEDIATGENAVKAYEQ